MINGVVLLDKPPGLSSNSAVQRVKRLLGAKKAGHTGSLDPIATGLLPVCLGEATKLAAFLLDDDKRYETRVRLGITTASADIEGEVLETRDVPELNEEKIEAVLAQFRGAISQIPPMYSALKHQGQRLYELARKGVEVERAPRNIRIHELLLRGYGADYLDLEAHCSKGTYIRSLAADIGEALGCGGHVELLRRTAVGALTLQQGAVSLDQMQRCPDDARLPLVHPSELMVQGLIFLEVDGEQAVRLSRGQTVIVSSDTDREGIRKVVCGDAFLGMAELKADGGLVPRRWFSVPISRVSPVAM
ncbi:tRNA pseudouridine(55) synthase TruB [Candidatus Methylospira mobilis]|uniref:tRNA pseudouridine(55) synthase TruB n=1 Tax=Candidatus Methylospira mobilis TaxID=1808979 RepID=UPI001D175F34|nr:tRNA pseudouridine(55) synthase TruB [Candidatus Methylospira mobilis]WNV03840.1 tRNA pseudouridine(55) synthase TruB [Candidatus Methylospira mobilis]